MGIRILALSIAAFGLNINRWKITSADSRVRVGAIPLVYLLGNEVENGAAIEP